MVQSPFWEANWFAAREEIPRISWNPKVHYRTHKRPPPVSILGQPNPVHIPTSHLLEIHPHIIHPSTPRSPQWSFSLRFPHQDPIHPLSSPIHSTCPAHLILLDFITRTILDEKYKSFSSSLCNLLYSSVTSSVLGPNILLNRFEIVIKSPVSKILLQRWKRMIITRRRFSSYKESQHRSFNYEAVLQVNLFPVRTQSTRITQSLIFYSFFSSERCQWSFPLFLIALFIY